MGPDARKPFIVLCEHQKRRPACTSAQSGQRICYLLSGEKYNLSSYMQNFVILASLCSLVGL